MAVYTPHPFHGNPKAYLWSELNRIAAAIASGGTLVPAALTRVNDTNVIVTLGGTPSTALVNAASITMGWSGQLSAARGGTGTGTYAVGDLLYADTTTTLAKRAVGADGQVLTLASGVPTWAAGGGGGGYPEALGYARI